MKEVSCTRGFGKITDPQTGTEYSVERDTTVEVADDVAERLKNSYPGIVLADADPPDDAECGVNGCSRAVADPDATCWQH